MLLQACFLSAPPADSDLCADYQKDLQFQFDHHHQDTAQIPHFVTFIWSFGNLVFYLVLWKSCIVLLY